MASAFYFSVLVFLLLLTHACALNSTTATRSASSPCASTTASASVSRTVSVSRTHSSKASSSTTSTQTLSSSGSGTHSRSASAGTSATTSPTANVSHTSFASLRSFSACATFSRASSSANKSYSVCASASTTSAASPTRSLSASISIPASTTGTTTVSSSTSPTNTASPSRLPSSTSTPSHSLSARASISSSVSGFSSRIPTQSGVSRPSSIASISSLSSLTSSICSSASASTLQSYSPTPSASPHFTRSVSVTLSSTHSVTSRPSRSPSFSRSSSSSPSRSISQRASRTGTSSPSQTQSTSTTASALATATPSTPPPFDCAYRDGGCQALEQIRVATEVPQLPIPFTSTQLLVSLPLVISHFSILLPVAPTSGEALTFLITDGSQGKLRYTSNLPRCSTSASGTGNCFNFTADPSSATLLSNFSVSTTLDRDFSTNITCTLASRYLSSYPTTSLPFPRYRTSMQLDNITVTSYPLSMPLLSAVFRETTLEGKFVALADGTVYTLPPPPCSTLAARSGRSVWESSSLSATCPGALSALQVMTATLANRSVSMSATISGSTHLILFTTASPFPTEANALQVRLGSAACRVNWVTANFASITTPDIPDICSSTPANASDCGLQPLLTAFVSPRYLQLYTAYPPLLPSASWASFLTAPTESTPFPLYASMSSLPLPQLTEAATLASAASGGIRVLRHCTDPSFASFEQCAEGAATLLGRCLWGNGSVCKPCPAGAACPGGPVLEPLPGYWLPSPSSPMSTLFECLSPGATLRCPGLTQRSVAADGTYGCGTGYKGQACASCAEGYTFVQGSCLVCPQFSLTDVAGPLLVLIGSLLAVGGLIVALVYCSMRYRGMAGVGLLDAARPVRNLLVWSWIASQALASLFSQAEGLAPPYLKSLYSVVGALQLRAIPLNPKCYAVSNSPIFSFLPFYVCLGVVVLCYALLAAALCCLRRPDSADSPSSFSCCSGLASHLLYLLLLALSLTYGSFTSSALATLVCTTPQPMTVLYYLQQTQNDCSALQAAYGGGFSCQELLAGSLDPNASPAITAALQQPLLVSVMASNPYQVCNEAGHRWARTLATGLLAGFTLTLPLGTLAVLWLTGHLKCLRRSPVLAAVLRLAPEPPPTPRPLLQQLREANEDPALLPSMTWYPALQQLQLALVTAMAALSTARLPRDNYIVSQASIILVSVAGCVLAWRMRLFEHENAWRSPVLLLINLVTAVTAVINTALLLGDLSGPAKEALATVPLVLSVATVATLLLSWGRSMSHYTLKLVAPPKVAKSYRTATPWVAVRDAAAGGEQHHYFWHNAKLQESLWVLPAGAVSSCGWRQQGRGGGWVNARLGATSPTPPKAEECYKHRQWRRQASGVQEGEQETWYVNVMTRETAWQLPYGGLEVHVKRRPVIATLNPLLDPRLPSNLWMPSSAEEGYWCNVLGEEVHTLPAGAATSCGWVHCPASQLWQHAGSGALILRQPVPGSELQEAAQRSARQRCAAYQATLQAGSAWSRTPDERAWLQGSTGRRERELPDGAHTACGWWQQAELGVWVHWGSGATLKHPPPLSSRAAMRLVVHYLYAVSSSICTP